MRIYSENRKAGYDYEILERFEAGMVLFGQEVKSIKTGHANLAGSYIVFKSFARHNAAALGAAEPYLVGAKVPPYQPNNVGADYPEGRPRKILLNKKEINYLLGKSRTKGFSLIPLKIYENHGRIKLEFGLVRGKKKYDKKQKIKDRDTQREVNRELSE